MAKPFQGVRVLDFTQVFAGPFGAYQLALLGADVIKIERPGPGDDTRQWTPQLAEGMSATYATLNRGKRSIAID
ncbi:MAG: CoA transferase, partial [Myxococcales bacterium]|nr:CoA transferase [Myxococcales bacterium]